MKYNLARALSDSTRREKAIPLWQELIEKYPKHLGFKLEFAQCYLQLGQMDACEKILLELPDQVQQLPAIQLMLGEIRLHRGEVEAALEHFKRAETDEPEMPSLHIALGRVYVLLKKWDEAEREFQKALVTDGDNAVAYDGLAQVALAHEQYADALDHALRAVGLVHHYPPAHLHLGQALVGMEMIDQAIQAFETCLSISPGMKFAHMCLAKLYRADDRDVNQAQKHELMAMRGS